MIEQIYDINGAYDLFKSYNLIGNENCIFYMVNEETISLKEIATGVVLGAAINAVGLSVIGVTGNNENNNGKKIAGYLVNQTEKGIGLIPLETDRLTDAIQYMKIIPDSYMFIEQKNIKNIKVEKKLVHSLDSSIRIITIECTNGQKLIFRTYLDDKYIKYQSSNFEKFASRYGFEESKVKKITYAIIKVALIVVLVSIFVVPIIGVIVALNS